jgi:hypothetical protein
VGNLAASRQKYFSSVGREVESYTGLGGPMGVRAIECVGIDTAKWTAWVHVTGMTHEEEASFLDDFCCRCLMGDADWVTSFPFVEDVKLERRRSVSRAGVHPAVRERVLAAGECAYCGATDDLSVDHIIPLSKGGTSEEANLQCLCLLCNIRKGAR